MLHYYITYQIYKGINKYLLAIFQIFVQVIRKLEIGNCVYCGLLDPGNVKHSVHSELLDTHDTSNLVWLK